MNMNSNSRKIPALAFLILGANSASAAFIAYHDFGAATGQESTGNITTHQSGIGSAVALDTSEKGLINFADGSATGVNFSITGANAMDARDGGQAAGPAAATPAAALFNIPGLNLSSGLIYEGGNGGEGATRITLINLNPGLLYDLAFYGNRTVAEGLTEQFTLGGAEASFNLSSSGNIDAVTTRLDTRLNTDDVIRWTGINPGADGMITVTMDPEWDGELANVGYLGAMRLEESIPEPSSAALLVLGGLTLLRRCRK